MYSEIFPFLWVRKLIAALSMVDGTWRQPRCSSFVKYDGSIHAMNTYQQHDLILKIELSGIIKEH
jgi:hypothetical protein